MTPTKPGIVRKAGTCYFCGKICHYSKECRSRLAREKQVQQQQSQPVIKTEPQVPSVTATPNRPGEREMTCYTCQQKGDKSPQSPQRQSQVKRIQIPSDKVVPLRDNELFGSVGAHRMPITYDSGADISVLPEDSVLPEQFTGTSCEIDSFNKIRSSGKLCNVTISIDGTKFMRKAVTQQVKTLHGQHVSACRMPTKQTVISSCRRCKTSSDSRRRRHCTFLLK